MKKYFIILLVLFFVFPITSCNKSNNSNNFISDSEFLLDTIVNIKIYNIEDESIFDSAFNRIRELENTLSVHIKGSDLYNIKNMAGKEFVKVSEETLEVINRSLEYSNLSSGLFDITAGPLIDLWAIDPPYGHVPSKNELDNILPLINYKKLNVNKSNGSVMLEKDNMVANLGAIAKGYIADKLKETLIANGVEHAIINLGGNVLLIGSKPDNSDFRIGVQDPESERNEYLGILSLSDYSVVSSGDYERYFMDEEGKKYHHILNPFTGFPAENELSQVTIISKKSVDGDALSTTTFLMGLEEGMGLIEKINDVEAIFITKNHKIYLSSGIDKYFEFDEENYGEIYEVVK